MGGILLIVEAPKKAKTIARFFSELTVKATVGHVVDLPVKEMGVEPPEHKPMYEAIKGKEKVIAGLRGAANASDKIYIATDLDREGEAIAAHVNNLLGKKHASKISRVTYTEINRSAIQKAIASSHSIRWPLVRAQEARRVVDRYVGYLISKVLTQKVKQSLSLPDLTFLSAGRVQSVAVKLIVQRQREIARFKPVSHYGVRAIVHQNSGSSFIADWVPGEGVCDQNGLMVTQSLAQTVKETTHQLRHYKSESKRAAVMPPKPLTTEKFVQFCSGKLKITTKAAMASAQRLYEQGLITYHRTDSPVMSDEAVQAVRRYAVNKSLPIPDVAPVYSASASAQEAHECLRVSDIELESPNDIDPQDQSVYRLIWEVTLLSQLDKGWDSRQTVCFLNETDEKFTSRGRTLINIGWRAFPSKYFSTKHKPSNNADEQPEQQLPQITDNAIFNDVLVSLQEKKTKPPQVLTEKTLVEQLARLGVGRPSTYAQTIEKIVSMKYVVRESKTLRFQSTSLGAVIVDALVPYFKFMDEHYTAELESSFDQIATNKADYHFVVDNVYQRLQKEIAAFESNDIKTNVKSDELSEFCKTTKKNTSRKSDAGKSNGSSNANKTSCNVGDPCPDCKKGKVEKRLFKNDPEKQFLGCNQFPGCRFFAWPKSTG
jgi:DNA topoisomerase I